MNSAQLLIMLIQMKHTSSALCSDLFSLIPISRLRAIKTKKYPLLANERS